MKPKYTKIGQKWRHPRSVAENPDLWVVEKLEGSFAILIQNGKPRKRIQIARLWSDWFFCGARSPDEPMPVPIAEAREDVQADILFALVRLDAKMGEVSAQIVRTTSAARARTIAGASPNCGSEGVEPWKDPQRSSCFVLNPEGTENVLAKIVGVRS